MDIGSTISHYKVTAKLGQGGMGEVYEAEDTRLRRQVAIKVLPAELADDTERLARLEREAQVLASLNHPNIGAIYGLEEADGSRALVLELVDGPTLEERLAQAGRFNPKTALKIALQVAEALEVAHERGVVHRDLKPANVKVVEGEGGEPLVKVLDFGLAKAINPEADENQATGLTDSGGTSPTLSLAATQAGIILGTAAYMSPEQAKGQAVDRRADIWAFGVVLYEMLSGRRLFHGDSVSEVLAAVILQPPAWDALPGDTPVWIFALLERCLTRDPRNRLRDIGEARVTIDRHLTELLAQPAPLIDGRTASLRMGPAADGDITLRTGEYGAVMEKAEEAAARAVTAARGKREAAEAAAARAKAHTRAKPAADPERGHGWSGYALAFLGAILVLYVGNTLLTSPTVPDVTRMSINLIDPTAQGRAGATAGGVASDPRTRERLNVEVGSAIALSPDGRRLAYVTETASRTVLQVRELGELTSRELRGTEGARHPFFSPDGEWVGFFTDDALEKVAFAGGAAVHIADVEANSRGADWGADGTIVFVPSVAAVVHRVADSGGPVSAVTSIDVDPGRRAHRFPDLLPDGRGVIYTAGNPASFERAVIRAYDFESGEDRELFGGMYARYLAEVDLVAYVLDNTLFVVPFDAQSLETTGDPVPVVDAVASSSETAGAQYTVSENGSLIYLPAGMVSNARQPLVELDAEGAATRVVASPDQFMHPRLSPDGERLVVTIGDSLRSDLFVYDLADDAVRRLTFDGAGNGFPVWTPDGERIVFGSTRDSDPARPVRTTWIRNADGTGEAERVSPPGVTGVFPFDFHPDGTALLMQALNPNTGSDLMVLQFEDGRRVGELQPFASAAQTQYAGRFSPDGRWVAYVSNESGRSGVYVTSYPDAAGKWQVSEVGTLPLWAPDGRTLYFQRGDEVVAVDVDAAQESFRYSAARTLFEGPYVTLDFEPNWDIHPAGDRFIVRIYASETSGETPPVLVLNWFEELRRATGR